MIRDIKEILVKLRERHDSFLGVDNPQVIEVRIKTAAEIKAFEAVLHALRGNKIFLNIYKD
ncbi:MAG: hypothetical protein RBR08_15195 [Desulforegulaceae bacterium]|nr:hypothetical protein [Desulforegulaceae bacterium]